MILGIESSCDETALSLFDPGSGFLGEWVRSQIESHADYGGVVPDLAVSEHLANFTPLLDLVRGQYEMPGKISKIAVTCGPGLIGCLGIGLSVAKSLGLLWRVPVVGVNHLRGHAFSPFMGLALGKEDDWEDYLPHLGLLVSGGNTLLFRMDDERKIEVLARTVDDAAGEALDKGGKLLGIPYPGGAELERKARGGDDLAFLFPRAFPGKNEMKFSFSGLKTSLLYTLKKMKEEEIRSRFEDLCASYQQAAVDQLVKMTNHVLDSKKYKSFGLSGGVANNEKLRFELAKICEENEIPFLPAQKKHTGDNAAMIAFCAAVDPMGLWPNDSQRLSFIPNLLISDLPA